MDIFQINRTSSVTKKGQITIPVYFRNKFGIKAGTKVYFEIDADQIKIKPVKYSLDSAYASVKPLKKKLTIKEVRKIALEDKLNATR